MAFKMMLKHTVRMRTTELSSSLGIEAILSCIVKAMIVSEGYFDRNKNERSDDQLRLSMLSTNRDHAFLQSDTDYFSDTDSLNYDRIMIEL